MYAVISRSEAEPKPAGLQRARGVARAAIACRADGVPVPRTLYQAGSYKLRRTSRDTARALELSLINTAGGVTGGDRFACNVALEAGVHAVVTTPASEKIYRSTKGEAVFEMGLAVAPGARLDWLPQETIVFEAGRFKRHIRIDLEGTGEVLMAEGFVFGRQAMGETLRQACMHDRWELRRDGRLVFAEALRLGPHMGADLALPTVLGEHVAVAGVLLAGPRGGGLLEPLRALLDALPSICAGASLMDGLLIARMAAKDGLALRHALVATIGLLGGRGVPRGWLC